MKKFTVIYHASASAMKQMPNASPEEMQKGMEPWMAWAKRCGDALVDMGSPLAGGQKVTKLASSPSGKGVVGYSVLQADNMATAQALVKGHPHLDWASGCEIEVHESMPIPM